MPVQDVTDIAAFLQPYMPGGSAHRGLRWYVRARIGLTKRRAHAWSYRGLPLWEGGSPQLIALEIHKRLMTEKKWEPMRVWIEILEEGDTNPNSDNTLETELEAREDLIGEGEDDDSPPRRRRGKTLADAVNDGDMTKIVGHVLLHRSTETSQLIDALQRQADRDGNEIIALRSLVNSKDSEIIKLVGEKVTLQSEKTVLEVRMGLALAGAVRDGIPHIALALQNVGIAWAQAKGTNGNKEATASGQGSQPGTNTAGSGAEAPGEKRAPTRAEVEQVLDACMMTIAEILQADPDLLTQERFSAFEAAWGKMSMYATFKGYARTSA